MCRIEFLLNIYLLKQSDIIISTAKSKIKAFSVHLSKLDFSEKRKF